MSNVSSNSAGTSSSVPVTLLINPTPSLSVSDESDIRDQILTTLQADYAQNGITINVQPNSDYYILATSIARWGTTIEANAVVSVDSFMPDSTQDFTILARWMAFFGLAPRAASGAYGVVTITCSAPSSINVGQQLTDSLQQVYQVTQAGVYASGATVPVQALSTGSTTDHLNGDILTWVSSPPYASSTASVGTLGASDGLVNGSNAEDIETARARLLLNMASPMGGGNAQTIMALGAESSGAVAITSVYPAYNGPSTVAVACSAYATNLAASNAKSRALPSALINSTILPYVTNNLAEYVECLVTGTTDIPVDLCLGLTLPASPSASPPGPGGGFLDAVPWPSNATNATTFNCPVTAVTSTTQITVTAPSLPIAGVSSIAYLDPSTWQIFTAHVVSFTNTGSFGAYSVSLVLDSPLVNITTSAYIWAQSTNQQLYVNAILGSFANLGPGEKTAAAGLLPRASRKPLPSTAFSYFLNDLMLRSLTQSDPAVAGSSFLYCSYGTPPIAPAIPALNTSPPGIFVPRSISFAPA